MSRLACCRCNSDSSCCSFARVLCVCVSRNPPQDRCDIFKMNLNCAIFNHFENENTNSSRAMQPKWNQSNPMANNNWRRFGMPATRCWCTQRSSSRMYMNFCFCTCHLMCLFSYHIRSIARHSLLTRWILRVAVGVRVRINCHIKFGLISSHSFRVIRLAFPIQSESTQK